MHVREHVAHLRNLASFRTWLLVYVMCTIVPLYSDHTGMVHYIHMYLEVAMAFAKALLYICCFFGITIIMNSYMHYKRKMHTWKGNKL